ncbi:MAG TPA: hypothetical protein VE988_27270 [Gemmataceae bacterium]|nr:hypothetical protein [Gemmataceae bacterium]
MIFVRTFHHYRPQVLASLALALALFMAPAAAQAADLYMVSVGVNNAKGQVPLTAPAKDAKDMAAWAHTQEHKLFDKVNVVTLTNNSATMKNVLANLNVMKSKAKAGDYVMFYTSSHGGDNGMGQYIMCMYDGNLAWSDVLSTLKGSKATNIAILDTCESGMALSSPGLVVFASSKANQNSLDGKSNSLYTQYFLDGLHGKADANKNGYVSLSEAASYASKMLISFDKGLKLADQQNSRWSHPSNVDPDLAIAKVSNGHSGKVYNGTENLGGYGKLTFTLETSGKAIMNDTHSTVNGTWKRTGNQITISFPNVHATYVGQLNGNVLAGTATNTKDNKKWSFSVNQTN